MSDQRVIHSTAMTRIKEYSMFVIIYIYNIYIKQRKKINKIQKCEIIQITSRFKL